MLKLCPGCLHHAVEDLALWVAKMYYRSKFKLNEDYTEIKDLHIWNGFTGDEICQTVTTDDIFV